MSKKAKWIIFILLGLVWIGLFYVTAVYISILTYLSHSFLWLFILLALLIVQMVLTVRLVTKGEIIYPVFIQLIILFIIISLYISDGHSMHYFAFLKDYEGNVMQGMLFANLSAYAGLFLTLLLLVPTIIYAVKKIKTDKWKVIISLILIVSAFPAIILIEAFIEDTMTNRYDPTVQFDKYGDDLIDAKENISAGNYVFIRSTESGDLLRVTSLKNKIIPGYCLVVPSTNQMDQFYFYSYPKFGLTTAFLYSESDMGYRWMMETMSTDNWYFLGFAEFPNDETEENS